MDIDKEYVSRTSQEYLAADRLFRSHLMAAQQSGKLTPTLVHVDRAMAQVLMDCNEGNRNIRPGKLAQYRRDMLEGRFKENGESIIIGTNGRLLDGQHRLRSVLETGCAYDMAVSFGVDPDSMDTVDQGAARKTADFLKISGTPNSHTVASMLKMVLAYERAQKESNVPAGTIQLGSPGRVTSAEVVERLEDANQMGDFQLIADAASYANSNNKAFKGMLTPQLVAFVYWLLARKSQHDAVTVLDKIRTQLGFTSKDPIFVTYQNLKKLDARNAPVTDRVEAMVRGWNNYRRGNQVSRIALQGVIPVPR